MRGENRFRPKGNATLTLTPLPAAAPTARSLASSGHAPTADILSQIIVEGLEDAKAEDIVSIDLSGKTTLADRMIIASGRSSVHVGAIADRVVRACRNAGFPSPKVEGMPLCDWVLLDAQNAIVHIFRPDVRKILQPRENVERGSAGRGWQELRRCASRWFASAN